MRDLSPLGQSSAAFAQRLGRARHVSSTGAGIIRPFDAEGYHVVVCFDRDRAVALHVTGHLPAAALRDYAATTRAILTVTETGWQLALPRCSPEAVRTLQQHL